MLVMSQLGCMAFGVLWASQWLNGAFDRIIRRSAEVQAQSAALHLAHQIAEVVGDRGAANGATSDNAAAGAKPSGEITRLCQQTKIPHDGFVSLIRNDGTLICDSLPKNATLELGDAPGLAQLKQNANTSLSLLDALKTTAQRQQETVAGNMEFGGREFRVTAVNIPELNAALAVAIPEEKLSAMVAELITPLMHVGFILIAAVVGATALCTMFLVRRFDSTLLEVSTSVEREVDRRTHALQRSRNAVVFGLSKLAESRDKDAGHHLEHLRTYVTILASELAKHNSKIDHHYVANLAIASALHDVGKMGVPDAVILKLGKLTAAERRAMQMHTVLGDECLAAVERMFGDQDQFLKLAREVAASHHEQWDGSGYPHGLQGKEIPLSARIVARADVYDALTSHRAYRPAASHAEAREWIVSHYGSQFDPEVVEAFIAREADFAKISQAAFRASEASNLMVKELDEAGKMAPASERVG